MNKPPIITFIYGHLMKCHECNNYFEDEMRKPTKDLILKMLGLHGGKEDGQNKCQDKPDQIFII